MMSNLVDEVDVASGKLFYGTRNVIRATSNWYPSGSAKKHLAAEFL